MWDLSSMVVQIFLLLCLSIESCEMWAGNVGLSQYLKAVVISIALEGRCNGLIDLISQLVLG